MRAFCLAGDQVEACWEDFAHFFEDFERGGADIAAVEARARAKAQKIQVWGLQDDAKVHGIVTTEIIRTAHGLVCVVTMAQGEAPDESKRALLESIMKWAKGLGCDRVRVHGRKGWTRWDRRFKNVGVIAEAPL